MSYLEELNKQRDILRSQEREITQKIKDERSRIAEEKRIAKSSTKDPTISSETYHKLKNDNSRLRGLLAMLSKTENTYNDVAEMLGVSVGRAREIVEKEKRFLTREYRDKT